MNRDELMIGLVEMRLAAGTVMRWRGIWVMALDEEHVAIGSRWGIFICLVSSFRRWWEVYFSF